MTLLSSHRPQVCHTDTELSLRFTAGDWGQHLIRREWPGRRGLRSPISLSQRRNHAANTASDPGINEGFMIHQNEWIRESMSVYLFTKRNKSLLEFVCYRYIFTEIKNQQSISESNELVRKTNCFILARRD